MEQPSFYGADNAFRERGRSPYQCLGLEVVQGRTCQLSCEACYKRDAPPTHRVDTPTEAARGYIDQAKEAGFSEVAFLGGEPTLHRGIFELIRHTRHIGISPILATNGMRFAQKEVARQLEGSDATVVTHAYFPDGEAVIDRYSGKTGYAEQLKRAIENITRLKDINVVLEMPLVDSLFPYAFTFFRYCREHNIIPFVEMSRPRNDGTRTTGVGPEQVAELFEKCREYDRQFFPGKAANDIHPPAYGMPCTMSVTGLHVKNNGGGVSEACIPAARSPSATGISGSRVFKKF